MRVHVGNVSVLDGIKIGDGAIIAAEAVAIKDVPPYCIVGGVPAKDIKYRFDSNQIEKLLELKWWDKDIEWIKENIDIYKGINVFIEGERK